MLNYYLQSNLSVNPINSAYVNDSNLLSWFVLVLVLVIFSLCSVERGLPCSVYVCGVFLLVVLPVKEEIIRSVRDSGGRFASFSPFSSERVCTGKLHQDK